MLVRETVGVGRKDHTKQINTSWGQNKKFLNVTGIGKYSYQRAWKFNIFTMKIKNK
jgi:hypothetical protein